MNEARRDAEARRARRGIGRAFHRTREQLGVRTAFPQPRAAHLFDLLVRCARGGRPTIAEVAEGKLDFRWVAGGAVGRRAEP